jgi:hypothetical protein
MLVDKSCDAAHESSAVGRLDCAPGRICSSGGSDCAVGFLDARSLQLGDGLFGCGIEYL